MNDCWIIGRDGRRRRAREGEVLGDGERFSLPLRFMDAALRDGLAEKFGGPARVVDAAGAPAGHRPGFLMTDRPSAFADAAAAAYEERVQRLTNAWRHEDEQHDVAERHDAGEQHQTPALDATATAESAYREKCVRQREAWRKSHDRSI